MNLKYLSCFFVYYNLIYVFIFSLWNSGVNFTDISNYDKIKICLKICASFLTKSNSKQIKTKASGGKISMAEVPKKFQKTRTKCFHLKKSSRISRDGGLTSAYQPDQLIIKYQMSINCHLSTIFLVGDKHKTTN